MTSVAPPAVAAPAAPAAAPSAAPPSGPLTPNQRVEAALGVGRQEPAPAAPPQQQGQQQAAAAQSRLESFIASLPENERGPYLQELNELKATAGRARNAQSEAAQLQAVQEQAEFAAIQAVRAGADPFSLAQNLGVDVGDLIRAAEEAGGPINQTAPAGGQRQEAGGPPAAPDAGPTVQEFGAVWQIHKMQSALDHPKSWTKPLLDARRSAAQQRELADAALAQATIEGGDKAGATRLAEQYRANADRIEAEAEFRRDQRTAGLINVAQQQLLSKLQPLLDKLEAAEKADQAQAAVRTQWSGVAQEMRSARTPSGHAMFGPEGYGIMEVDAHGNVTRPTPEGQEYINKAQRTVLANGWPRNMASMVAALDLIVLEKMTFSDGASSTHAGGQGGSDMLPPGGPTPGNGQFRPSPAGAPANGSPIGMF